MEQFGDDRSLRVKPDGLDAVRLAAKSGDSHVRF
jgi:hypothetical protein